MPVGNTSNNIYLSVADGKIVRAFKTPTDNTTTRISKTGKTVYEEHYDYVEGLVTDIRTRENEYGKQWMIYIKDEEHTYILQMPYSGGTSAAFLKSLPNIDLEKPTRLQSKQTIEGDKKRSTIFLNQSGKAVKWAWTKENPGEMPQLKKVKIKGVEQWDDSEQMEFLEAYVNNNILPKLRKPDPEDASDIEEDSPF